PLLDADFEVGARAKLAVDRPQDVEVEGPGHSQLRESRANLGQPGVERERALVALARRDEVAVLQLRLAFEVRGAGARGAAAGGEKILENSAEHSEPECAVE